MIFGWPADRWRRGTRRGDVQMSSVSVSYQSPLKRRVTASDARHLFSPANRSMLRVQLRLRKRAAGTAPNPRRMHPVRPCLANTKGYRVE